MLGTLTKVDLRSEWKHEALDFTKWLAGKDNLALLAEELGLDELELQGTEVSVGTFAVDILAEESGTGKKVVIENQLETTDHDHLGKLLTYAAGLEAGVVIWVFKDMRDEHRQAMDWLNEISNGRVGFFAVQMELWKIDESPAAPKFNIICSPNDWAKAVQASRSGDGLSESKAFQLVFWTNLAEYLKNAGSILKPQQPRPQQWTTVSIGTSKAHMALVVSVRDRYIRTEFYIPDDKEFYFSLTEKKDEIEDKLGFAMDWQELPKAKAARISIQKDDVDLADTASVEEAYEWYRAKGERIRVVFTEYV